MLLKNPGESEESGLTALLLSPEKKTWTTDPSEFSTQLTLSQKMASCKKGIRLTAAELAM